MHTYIHTYTHTHVRIRRSACHLLLQLEASFGLRGPSTINSRLGLQKWPAGKGVEGPPGPRCDNGEG
eukprot:9191484-Pyramimonas_sp.AAC.1